MFNGTTKTLKKPMKIRTINALVLLGLVAQSVIPDPALAQNWTQTGAPSQPWLSVATSADGSKLAAAVGVIPATGFIYTSTNSGGSWTQTSAPSESWQQIASSADGTKLVAVGYLIGLIYTSTNGGVTWQSNNAATYPSAGFFGVASSGDGVKVVAVSGTESGVGEGHIYTSSDSGFTWKQTGAPLNPNWNCVGSSADGAILVAGIYGGGVYRSTNSGSTWAATTAPTGQWFSIVSSADGGKWVGASDTGVYTSGDAGITWNQTTLPANENWLYQSVASSADGTKLVAAAGFAQEVYFSSDSGATWTETSSGVVTTNGFEGIELDGVVSSADGTQLVAAPINRTGGSVYTWRTTPAPLLSLASAGANGVISWTIPTGNFGIQQNTDLTTTNWTNVATQPILNFGSLQYQTTVSPPSSGAVFYRLAGTD
jgi:hypothetical protein